MPGVAAQRNARPGDGKPDCPCRSPWPRPATYWFAGQSEPVVVVALGGPGELRIVDASGGFNTVPEWRIRLLEPLCP